MKNIPHILLFTIFDFWDIITVLERYSSKWRSLPPPISWGRELKVALLIQNKYPWPKCPKTNQTSNKQIQNKYISWFAVAIQVEWSGQGYRNSGVENLGEKAYLYRAVNVRYAPNLSRKIDHGHKNTQLFAYYVEHHKFSNVSRAVTLRYSSYKYIFW